MVSPITRVVSYTLSSLVAIAALSGCGFVNVSSLAAHTVKDGVAVVAGSGVLASSQVGAAQRLAPQDLSVVSLTDRAANTRLLAMLRAGSLTTVIAYEPNTGMQQLASQFSSVHFFFVGLAQNSPANVTWLVPTVTDTAASYAGYVAGRVTPPNAVIAAVYAGTAPTPAQTTLIADVQSGVNAAFSTATVRAVSAVLPPKHVQTAAARIVLDAAPLFGTTPSFVIALAQESGGELALAPGSVLGTALTTIWQSGIHAVWPGVSSLSLPLPVSASGYTNSANAAAIATYAADLQRRLVLPDQFVSGPPSLTEAQALHLPIN